MMLLWRHTNEVNIYYILVVLSLSQHDEKIGLESWYLAGADLNQADYSGRTALHVVRYNRNFSSTISTAVLLMSQMSAL